MNSIVKSKKCVYAAILSLFLGYATSSQASIFGEENAVLGAILSENIRQTVSFKETIEYLRAMTAFARDSAAFSREAVQVSKNLHAIMANPGEFAQYSTQAWGSAFPELGDIVANVEEARLSAQAVAHPANLDTYDPYVYVRLIDRARFLNDSSFEVLAHGTDSWGINGRYDAMLWALDREHTVAQEVLANAVSLVNGSGLSPVQASVSTAQSSAVSATAQVQATATLQRIARTQEWVVMQQIQSEKKSAEMLQREIDAVLKTSQPWVLDPLGVRRRSKKGGR